MKVHFENLILKDALIEEIDYVRVVTLNRPKQLNAISPNLVFLLAKCLENERKMRKQS
ncbi:unnamed protein product [Lathyrus sativus]|nr:unnamed protein product [Lathyrus sativus]